MIKITSFELSSPQPVKRYIVEPNTYILYMYTGSMLLFSEKSSVSPSPLRFRLLTATSARSFIIMQKSYIVSTSDIVGGDSQLCFPLQG